MPGRTDLTAFLHFNSVGSRAHYRPSRCLIRHIMTAHIRLSRIHPHPLLHYQDQGIRQAGIIRAPEVAELAGKPVHVRRYPGV